MTAPHVLFVIDPPQTFSPQGDTTLVLIAEAQRRGYETFGALLPWLGLEHGKAHAHISRLEGDLEGFRFANGRTRRPLADFAAILMRKDPPLDEQYLTSTWILDHAGAPVVNAPAGLRNLNEKLSISPLSSFTPQTYICRSIADLRDALDALGGRMILKPVLGFGGREVLLADRNDPNLATLFEITTHEESRWIVAQEYLPAASQGDKRILLVDGEPIGSVLRVPAQGALRNNFHAGGSPAQSELTERDQEICQAVGPLLRQHGQFFAGIDVIGDKLTEINVTSPTGMQEVNRLGRLDGEKTMQARFWTALAHKLGLGSASGT